MDRLLGEINRTTARARHVGADALDPSLLATYRHRYDELIQAGWAAECGHLKWAPLRPLIFRQIPVNVATRVNLGRQTSGHVESARDGCCSGAAVVSRSGS